MALDPSIQAMVDQATTDTDAENSASNLLTSLFTALQQAIANVGSLSAADRATIDAKVASMKAGTDALAAAIVANTPAA